MNTLSNRRILIIQPAIPTYRIDFFARIAAHYQGALTVYASPAGLGALTPSNDQRHVWYSRLGNIIRLGFGIDWQVGALSIDINQGDIVVVCGAPRCVSNILLFIKSRLCGATSIWWGHYWSSTSRYWRFALRLLLMRLSHGLLFYTDNELDEYHALFGAWKQKIFALNNGIAVEEIQALRLSYFQEARPRSLLFIGRLTEKAELGLLLNAMTSPELEYLDLHIIGEGECQQQYEALAKALDICDRITWHGPLIDETSIAAVVNQCALFVYPGGVGLSLLHAMAYGLPVIVHDDRYRHMPEIAAFKEGVTGLSFRYGDVQDLALQISRALNSVEQCNLWSIECQKMADMKYNTAEMADRFIAMIQKLEV